MWWRRNEAEWCLGALIGQSRGFLDCQGNILLVLGVA